MNFSILRLLFVTMVTIVSFCHASPLEVAEPHRIAKRSFFNLQCKGVYDVSIIARLDRVCEDCYNLFRTDELFIMCRESCFTTEYFKGCVEALQLQDQLNTYKEYIKIIHGADPHL